jgi:glycosyltransferase involved in cell wall biosynthesis
MQMKIIYYSTAYFASHGGSNHSKSFVAYSRQNKDVDELIVFPQKEILKKPLIVLPGKKKTFSGMLKKSPLTTVLRFFRRNNFYLEELFNVIKSQQPDAIVIRLDSNFLQLTKLKKKFPYLIVATEVNASPFDESFKKISFRPFFQRLERKHLANADVNFFVSDTLRKKIMKSLCDENRDLVLPNGVDTSLFTPTSDKAKSKRDLGLPVEKKIVGYVGTLDISKRMKMLIEAYSILRKIRNDVYFVIVGDGPEFPITKAEIIKNNLQDSVSLTGSVAHTEVPKYLHAFDVAIHHAANDYMCPLKIFEYLAAGLPVIGPDTPAVREIFDNGKHLLLCQPNTESIVEKLNTCLDNLSTFEPMIREGNKMVNKKYTWQINADTVIDKIKSIKMR